MHRALELRAALKLGLNISLEEIRADELQAMLILEKEMDSLDREQSGPPGSVM